MLFLDGHASHDTAELVNNAHALNIKILSYPSHTTHVLQGLDVICFARLKQKHAEKIREFKENNNLTITHKSFLHTFGPAFLEAFTPEMVKTAFSATGIYPFRRDVVSSEKMGPSEALTTNPLIPGTLATPVRKAISAFSKYRSPSPTGERTESEFIPSKSFIDDLTPTKRAKILHASLKTSSSTSFLVSKIPVRASSIRVHQPNYEKPPATLFNLDFSASSGDEADMSEDQIRDENKELRQKLKDARKHIRIRDQAIKANHAEMIIQDATNRQLHMSLFLKEASRKKKNPALDFAHGRHVTSDESRMELQWLKDEKDTKEREKRERATTCATKREKKAINDEKWNRVRDRHEMRM